MAKILRIEIPLGTEGFFSLKLPPHQVISCGSKFEHPCMWIWVSECENPLYDQEKEYDFFLLATGVSYNTNEYPFNRIGELIGQIRVHGETETWHLFRSMFPHEYGK